MSKQQSEQLQEVIRSILLDPDRLEFGHTKTNMRVAGTVDRIMNKVDEYVEAQLAEPKINENTSDGYHTFKELYEYRMLYNAALFNEWALQGKYGVHKSNKHSDGQLCFGGGWFVVVATLPTGQITNHYETKDWGLFNIPAFAIADKWDGHTPQDVAKRLCELSTTPQTKEEE